MKATRELMLPKRERVAVLLKARSARLAALHDWRFWRWRPKMTLLTLQVGALLAGSIVLLCLHWAPWIPLKTLRGHKGPVTSVSFSSDGKQIVSSSEDRTARVWDFVTDKQICVVPHAGAVLSAQFKNDAKELATTCDDGVGRYFGLPAGGELGIDDSVRPKQVRVSNDGNQFLWFDDDTISWKDLDGLPHQMTLSWTLSLCTAAFSQDGKRIVTADTGGDVRVWDAKTERVLAHLSGDKNCFQGAAFSLDGRYIATSGKDGAVRLWEAVQGNEKGSLLQGEAKEAPAGLTIWYAQRVALMKGHSLYVLSSQFSPDGERLATASLDGTVRVWDGKTGAALATLSGTGTLRNAAFSPDGGRIVAGGNDGVIQIWERRRAEGMAGVVTLSEFWLMVLLAPAFVWSLRRDRKIFAPRTVGSAHQSRVSSMMGEAHSA